MRFRLAAEAPPKTKAVLKATVITEGKPDRVILCKELSDKGVLSQVYNEPKNTAADHGLLVPHQVLAQEKPTAPAKTHSVLVQPTCPTCTSEQHDSGTYPQNRNFNLRLPGFGGGGFHL